VTILRYVGIDPGTNCGWGVLDQHGGLVASGTWMLDRAKTDGPGMRAIRLERLLRELVAPWQPHEVLVAYDLVHPYGSVSAVAMYYKLVGRLESCLDELGIAYGGVRPGTYKKHATGKGNAQKDAMVEAAVARWPELGTIKHDEADALWIADSAREGLI